MLGGSLNDHQLADACKTDMTEARMKDDNTTNRAAYGGIRSSAIPATPDDGTSQA